MKLLNFIINLPLLVLGANTEVLKSTPHDREMLATWGYMLVINAMVYFTVINMSMGFILGGGTRAYLVSGVAALFLFLLNKTFTNSHLYETGKIRSITEQDEKDKLVRKQWFVSISRVALSLLISVSILAIGQAFLYGSEITSEILQQRLKDEAPCRSELDRVRIGLKNRQQSDFQYYDSQLEEHNGKTPQPSASIQALESNLKKTIVEQSRLESNVTKIREQLFLEISGVVKDNKQYKDIGLNSPTSGIDGYGPKARKLQKQIDSFELLVTLNQKKIASLSNSIALAKDDYGRRIDRHRDNIPAYLGLTDNQIGQRLSLLKEEIYEPCSYAKVQEQQSFMTAIIALEKVDQRITPWAKSRLYLTLLLIFILELSLILTTTLSTIGSYANKIYQLDVGSDQ